MPSWTNNLHLLQSFYPLVSRAQLDEDMMPVELMHDRRLEFVDYSKLRPFTVSEILIDKYVYSCEERTTTDTGSFAWSGNLLC